MSGEPQYRRFGRLFLIQHWILIVSVLLLIVSGVPLKFPDSAIAWWVIRLQGGMEMRGHIHHGAGWTLVLLGFAHFFYYLFIDRNPPFYKRKILLGPKDVRDFVHHIGYIVGLKKAMPQMDRYTWYEKLEYFGLLWGMAVMGFTGVVMYDMDLALRIMPLAWFQAFWAAHSTEAMEATLFLLIIHMYHVHFSPNAFPMSLTWLHGRISRREMEQHHPLELAELERTALEKAELEAAAAAPAPAVSPEPPVSPPVTES